jgi:hypothetical protein
LEHDVTATRHDSDETSSTQLRGAIEALNRACDTKIALETRHRDDHVTASLPRVHAHEVTVANGMTLKVSAADAAHVADEARAALAPALRLLHVALACAGTLEQQRGAVSPPVDLTHAISRFNDSAHPIEMRFSRSGRVAAVLPRSGDKEAVLARSMGDTRVRMHDVALIAHEARLALKPAFALLDAALAAMAELDLHAAPELSEAAR